VGRGRDGELIPVVLSVDLEPDGVGHGVDGTTTWSGVQAVRRWVDEVLGVE
jgi:hypothetical protein